MTFDKLAIATGFGYSLTMSSREKDFQSAHEIGKIYHSIVNKKDLCDYFLESVFSSIGATQGYLFLSGNNDQVWLESLSGFSKECPGDIEAQVKITLREVKPCLKDKRIFLPLVVQTSVMGVACFANDSGSEFEKEDLELSFNLACQLSGALKNILLYEEGLKMERLAAVGQTISMVMHELKNIIQIAKLADELVRRGIKNQNEKFLQHGLDGIAKALKEMDGFIWDMLSLTKEYHIEPQKVDLRTVVEELRQDFEEKTRELGIELDFKVEEGFPLVEADSRSIYRALLNLVQNSMEACDKDQSRISIRVYSKDENFYEIKLEDNGKGMTPEVRAKIFQAFFSTKGRKGNGLGLMIIERTCKAHKGKIHVDSELGKGSAFTLTFPKVIPRDGN